MGKETLTRREFLQLLRAVVAGTALSGLSKCVPQPSEEQTTLTLTEPTRSPLSSGQPPETSTPPETQTPTRQPTPEPTSIPTPEPTQVITPTEVPILRAGGSYPEWFDSSAPYIKKQEERIKEYFKNARDWFGAEIAEANNSLRPEDNFHFKYYCGEKVGEVMVALEPPLTSESYKNMIFTFGFRGEPIPLSLEDYDIGFRFHPAYTFTRIDRSSGEIAAFLDWVSGTWAEISLWERRNFSWVGSEIDCDGIKIKLALDGHYPLDHHLSAWTVINGDICEVLTRRYYEEYPEIIAEWDFEPAEEFIEAFKKRNPDEKIRQWVGNSIRSALTQAVTKAEKDPNQRVQKVARLAKDIEEKGVYLVITGEVGNVSIREPSKIIYPDPNLIENLIGYAESSIVNELCERVFLGWSPNNQPVLVLSAEHLYFYYGANDPFAASTIYSGAVGTGLTAIANPELVRGKEEKPIEKFEERLPLSGPVAYMVFLKGTGGGGYYSFCPVPRPF